MWSSGQSRALLRSNIPPTHNHSPQDGSGRNREPALRLWAGTVVIYVRPYQVANHPPLPRGSDQGGAVGYVVAVGAVGAIVDFLVVRDRKPWFLVEVKNSTEREIKAVG